MKSRFPVLAEEVSPSSLRKGAAGAGEGLLKVRHLPRSVPRSHSPRAHGEEFLPPGCEQAEEKYSGAQFQPMNRMAREVDHSLPIKLQWPRERPVSTFWSQGVDKP